MVLYDSCSGCGWTGAGAVIKFKTPLVSLEESMFTFFHLFVVRAIPAKFPQVRLGCCWSDEEEEEDDDDEEEEEGENNRLAKARPQQGKALSRILQEHHRRALVAGVQDLIDREPSRGSVQFELYFAPGRFQENSIEIREIPGQTMFVNWSWTPRFPLTQECVLARYLAKRNCRTNQQ